MSLLLDPGYHGPDRREFHPKSQWGHAWYRLVGEMRGNGITYSPRAVRDAMRDYEREECKRRASEHD